MYEALPTRFSIEPKNCQSLDQVKLKHQRLYDGRIYTALKNQHMKNNARLKYTTSAQLTYPNAKGSYLN